MTKLKVAAAVVVLVLAVLVLHSCRGKSGDDTNAEQIPDVDHGVVSIPPCSADTRQDALRVTVFRPVQGAQPPAYDSVQTCLGISQEMFTRVKQLGAVGVPADNRLVLVAVDLQDNRFRICGLADHSDEGNSVPAAAITCPSGGA